MATLLFKLYGVPEDEAQEVRELLEEAELAFYETSAGRWFLGVDALWLVHNEDLPEARRLLNEYQQKRYLAAQENAEQERAQGQQVSFFEQLQARPGRFLLSMLAILIILTLGFLPVVWLFF
ncbi:DUF6164 family protein [Marinospirillum perlucidum]|uniref:DUF6164 family protein n=1 Tax=Marinospirillum perlucidum TaxID=1982602 RepID=UPI000DF249EE|nr:DUF6164 family protein [Marinospirillum perlucidum]